MTIRIVATHRKTGQVEEIRDLYWFEENNVRWFDDTVYKIDIYVNGVKFYDLS